MNLDVGLRKAQGQNLDRRRRPDPLVGMVRVVPYWRRRTKRILADKRILAEHWVIALLTLLLTVNAAWLFTT
jgi:hypothetical protein